MIWDHFLSNCPVASLTFLLDNAIAFGYQDYYRLSEVFVNEFIHVNKFNIDVYF
jgi:hypothetical protein